MLEELYQELILDHNRDPRNFGELDDANHEAHGYNPLCGDKIKIQIRLNGDTIEDIRFHGKGCAISQATASIMTETIKGKTVAEAEDLFERFHRLLTEEPSAEGNGDLGKLEALAGVRQFPIRVKCATLPWHTFRAALKDKEGVVKTE